MSHLAADLRSSLRSAWKRPGTTALMVGTLAVGLAANGIIFNFLDSLVLRAFAFPNADRLVRVWETGRDFDGIDRDNVAAANFLDWREHARGSAVGEIAAIDGWDLNLRGATVPERALGSKVSPRFFDMLAVKPASGRGFLPAEDQPGSEHRIVLGHALWLRSFGGEPIVGKTVAVDGEPFEVVGIAPPGFNFPEGSEAWAPLVLPAAGEARRDVHNLSVMALPANGRTIDDVRAQLVLVAARLEKDHPETNTARGVDAAAFNVGFGDPVLPRIILIWQVGAVLVLLIACVNVTNLILARGAERQREMALRFALGAGRGRVIRQMMTEGAVTGLVAAIVSMPLVALGAQVVRDNMPADVLRFIPGWENLGADWRTLGFSAVLAVVATAVMSAVPALRASRADIQAGLRDGGRSVTVGASRQHGRNLLVVAQMAAALTLIATAAVALRSANSLLNGPQGYDPQGLLTFDVELTEKRYAAAEDRALFARNAATRLSEIAGVTAVGVANVLPARGANTSRPVEMEGQPLAKNAEPPHVDARWIEPGYFDAMRLPILEGRGVEAGDEGDRLPVAIVSRSMANHFWAGDTAIGKRFRAVTKEGDGPWLTVVGICGDVVHHWFGTRNAPTYYRPLRQDPRFEIAFALRTSRDPDGLAAEARQALFAVDPDQPADNVKSMRRAIAQSTIGIQYIAGIMSAFGVLALILAVSGVYGVLSYRISLRTLEIGVRMALGASRQDVLRLTLGQALRLAAIGLTIGAGLAYAGGRILSSVLQGAVVADVAPLAAAAGALAGAALVAAWLPARRALAVSPATALRSE